MLTDCFFTKGFDHEICQDYAICSENSIFLSDGCSSAKNSDVGSRLLSILAKKYEKQIFLPLEDFMFSEIIYEADEISKMLCMDSECLFSTLIGVNISKDKLSFFISGDGVVALVKKDGSILVYDIDFSKQAPKYLAYRLLKENENLFNSMTDNLRCVSTFEIKNRDKINFKKDFSNVYEDIFFRELPIDEFKYVVIFSDGIKTFNSDSNACINISEILPDIIDFKIFTSNFLKRRINRFLSDNLKKNISHYDDFSAAAIVI